MNIEHPTSNNELRMKKDRRDRYWMPDAEQESGRAGYQVAGYQEQRQRDKEHKCIRRKAEGRTINIEHSTSNDELRMKKDRR
jgi:hypothetical protein